MAVTVTKDKNIFSFEVNDRKYQLDINTGTIYGNKGRMLKNLPVDIRLDDFKESEYSILKFLYFIKTDKFIPLNEAFKNYGQFFIVVDKLTSLGYEINRSIAFLDYVELEWFKNNFNFVIKTYKENPHDSRFLYGNGIRYENLVATARFYFWLKSNNYVANEIFTEEIYEYVFLNFSRLRYSKKQIELIIGWLADGLYYCEDLNRISRIEEFFYKCHTLNYEPKKQDFLRQYKEVTLTYDIMKEKTLSNKVKEYQSKNESFLNFETDDIKVIVPKTKEEFLSEANQQNNCVARIYYEAVSREETNIVFIRFKNNINKSLVTCEVRNGKIIQFLKRYNETPKEKFLCDFRNLYQEHLNKVWEQCELSYYFI